MTSALLITVAAALCWSAFDACRKALVAETPPIALATVLAWAQAPVFATWALWGGDLRLEPSYLGPGLAVLVCNTGASIGFFTALRLGDLSRTVPLLSLSPVLAAVLGALVLGEALSGVQWAGVGLVVAGALGLGWAGGPGSRRAALWMLFTAAMWAATSVYDKVSLQSAAVAVHAGVQTLAMAALLTGWLTTRGRAHTMAGVRQRPGVFAAGVAVSTLALALQLEAVQRLPVGIMESVKRATGMVAAVLVGRLLFAEALSARKWLAVGAMAVGVWLVVG